VKSKNAEILVVFRVFLAKQNSKKVILSPWISFRTGLIFKERFFYVTKSLWMAQFVLLPTVLVLFLVNLIFNLEFSTINKIVVFSMSYLSQIALFFSYKLVTKSDWAITIKVVASQSMLTILLSVLLKFI